MIKVSRFTMKEIIDAMSFVRISTMQIAIFPKGYLGDGFEQSVQ